MSAASKQRTIASLGTLVELRSLDVDRLQADLASQEATRTRYQNNLARLDALTEGSGATTSVVASGELSERLSLRYGVGVFAPANTIALRYELTKRLYLEAASGLASSLDLFYKRDF